MKKILLLGFFLVLIALSNAYAIFDDYEPGVRARAMGGAFIAAGDDANAIFYNPAALKLSKNNIMTSYTKLFGLDFAVLKTASFCYNFRKYGNVALSIETFDVEYEGFSLMNEGTYSLAHSFLLIGDVHSQFYLGYSANLHHLSFEKFGNENCFSLNLGALAVLHQRTRIAFTVHRINNPSIGKERDFDLPQKMTIGLAYNPYNGVITELDLEKKFGEDTELHIGIEAKIIKHLYIRMGAKNLPTSLSAGFGVEVKGIIVDYAYQHHSVLNGTHHFGVGYKF